MVRDRVKRLLLNARIYFPLVSEVTSPLVSAYRRKLGGPRENGFRALSSLNVPETGVRLDIGAAAGDAAAMMRVQAPGAPVVSFEPNPFFAAKIRRRFYGDPTVKVETVALSDRRGTFLLHIPVYRRVAFPELGTLHRADAEDWLCHRVFKYQPDELMILECPCISETLDSFGLAPALMKIDCRCDAADVLAGACETLDKHQPVVVLERVPIAERCHRQLAESGYRPFVCSDRKLQPVAMGQPCDVLAVKAHLKRA